MTLDINVTKLSNEELQPIILLLLEHKHEGRPALDVAMEIVYESLRIAVENGIPEAGTDHRVDLRLTCSVCDNDE